jgi:hypothetical protein
MGESILKQHEQEVFARRIRRAFHHLKHSARFELRVIYTVGG